MHIDKLKIGAYRKDDGKTVAWIEIPIEVFDDMEEVSRMQNYCALLGFILEKKWKDTVKECHKDLLYCFYPKTEFEWIDGEYLKNPDYPNALVNLSSDKCDIPIS